MIRKAITSDSKRISEIVFDAWQNGFSEVINSDFPKTISIDKYTNMFTDNIENHKEDIFVYIESQNIIGFISGKNQEPTKYEIIGLYVDPKFQRHGIGKKLLQYIKKFCINQEIIYLHTLKGVKNNYFYTKNGFSIKEERITRIGGIDYQGLVYEFSS